VARAAEFFGGTLVIHWQGQKEMSRYKVKPSTKSKGRPSTKSVETDFRTKSIEKDFPHFVEVAVPLGGLGNKLIAMYDFHARHGVEPKRGHGRRDYGGSYIRWCFADPALAAAFAKEFDA
jgi:hypothetical protein